MITITVHKALINILILILITENNNNNNNNNHVDTQCDYKMLIVCIYGHETLLAQALCIAVDCASHSTRSSTTHSNGTNSQKDHNNYNYYNHYNRGQDRSNVEFTRKGTKSPSKLVFTGIVMDTGLPKDNGSLLVQESQTIYDNAINFNGGSIDSTLVARRNRLTVTRKPSILFIRIVQYCQ